MTPAQQLEALANEMRAASLCPELATQATQLVMGHGNPQARIVFIGEAPGKTEDLEGRPFLGAAGKMLNTLLESIELARDDVYITNIVKYRPPKNRDPKPTEKAAFWPYLLRELEIISPEVIVTLGRHSLSHFLPDAVIGEVHGQPQAIQLAARPVQLLPLYHPAAALYNGSLRQTLHDDFAQLADISRS